VIVLVLLVLLLFFLLLLLGGGLWFFSILYASEWGARIGRRLRSGHWPAGRNQGIGDVRAPAQRTDARRRAGHGAADQPAMASADYVREAGEGVAAGVSRQMRRVRG
jgi:hypothetical protein